MFKRKFNSYFPLIVAALSIGIVALAYELLSDGFNAHQISFPAATSFEKNEGNDLSRVLEKPLHYVRKEKECFVFSSEDERFLFKFLKSGKSDQLFCGPIFNKTLTLVDKMGFKHFVEMDQIHYLAEVNPEISLAGKD